MLPLSTAAADPVVKLLAVLAAGCVLLTLASCHRRSDGSWQ
jgi:hypothetical protein